MTVRRLEDFARALGIAVGLAQRQPHPPGQASTRIAALDVDLAATVERIDPRRHGMVPPGVKPGQLALRISRTAPGTAPGTDRPWPDGRAGLAPDLAASLPGGVLHLSIGVRGERGEAIEVRLDGQLLGRYGTDGHGEAI